MGQFSTADTNAFVSIGMQSAQGTPNTTAAKTRFLKYLSGFQVSPEMDVVDLREGGDGLDYGSTYKKGMKYTGQLVGNLRPEIAGQLFQLVPANATWDGASAPGMHTFSTISGTWPYATMQVAYPGTSLVHFLSDLKFTGLKIEGAKGEPIKVTMPFTAITFGASSTVFTPSYPGEPYFLYHNQPSYLIDGSADSTIDSWSIDLKYGVDELQAQAISLDDIALMNRDCDVQYTRRYQNTTLWKKIWLSGGVAPSSNVATGSLDVTNLLGTNSARFVVPLLSYRGNSLTELDPDGKTVYETVTGKALKGATAMLVAYIGNSHASAYAP
jgi:hypothetical protein